MSPVLALPLAAILALPMLGDRPVDHFNLDDRLALQGYDPVAYFPEGGGEPRSGMADISLVFDGATYRFANEANRARFAGDPLRYEPEYGGWCAYAMADGEKVEVDAESFLVDTDGRLFVFYDSFFADTRKRWLEDPGDFERRADLAWTRVTGDVADETAHLALDANGLALGGFDPVSYRMDTPRPGDVAVTVRLDGAVYRFADEAQRTIFLEAPADYLPRFGGWAADALARGEHTVADPELFLLVDDRLTLFATAEGRVAWEADADAQSQAALEAWEAGP